MPELMHRGWIIRLLWRGSRYRVSMHPPRVGDCGMTLPGTWGPGSRDRAIEFAKARIDMTIDGTDGYLSTVTDMGKAMRRLRQLERRAADDGWLTPNDNGKDRP